MTTTTVKTIAVLGLFVSLISIVLQFTGTPSFGTPNFGAIGVKLAENYDPYLKYNGGYNSQLPIQTTGTLQAANTTLTSSGTTTLFALSTSATKGWCQQFNATSTNTLLNLTFAASTTAASTVGVAPIIRYGACN